MGCSCRCFVGDVVGAGAFVFDGDDMMLWYSYVLISGIEEVCRKMQLSGEDMPIDSILYEQSSFSTELFLEMYSQSFPPNHQALPSAS